MRPAPAMGAPSDAPPAPVRPRPAPYKGLIPAGQSGRRQTRQPCQRQPPPLPGGKIAARQISLACPAPPAPAPAVSGLAANRGRRRNPTLGDRQLRLEAVLMPQPAKRACRAPPGVVIFASAVLTTNRPAAGPESLRSGAAAKSCPHHWRLHRRACPALTRKLSAAETRASPRVQVSFSCCEGRDHSIIQPWRPPEPRDSAVGG